MSHHGSLEAQNLTATSSLINSPIQKYLPTPYFLIVGGKEEASFQEVETGINKHKTGWKKIDFCAKQAGDDGLRYFRGGYLLHR